MNWNKADFERAFGTVEQLIECDMPEICFSGRSNVGKSSLINRLLNRKSLARVSGTPGKTVTINFYRLDGMRLADLPGYGYAKVSEAERERWSGLMEGYFRSGRDIRMVLQLVDMRHPVTEFDISMLEFLRYMNIPFTLVLTKCDKLNKSEFKKRRELIASELGEYAEGTEIVPFSALNGTGVQEIRDIIEATVIV